MSLTWDSPICHRCGEAYHQAWMDHATECKYEPCDDVSCKAKKYPNTPAEVWVAYQHWKHHDQSPGHCAHGRRVE